MTRRTDRPARRSPWTAVPLWVGLALICSGAVAGVDGEDRDDERSVIRELRVVRHDGPHDEHQGVIVLADRLRALAGKDGSVRVLAMEGRGERGYLGIAMAEERERADGGVRVLSVLPDSPAEKGGLRKDDVIVAVGGTAVGGTRGLSEQLSASAPGDRVELEVVRGAGRLTLEVELGERPRGMALLWDDEHGPRLLDLHEELGHALEGMPEMRGRLGRLLGHPRPKLGVQLTEVTPELREHLGGSRDAGVLVAKVMPGTAAERAGLRVGDLITAVDGRAIRGAVDLVDALSDRDGQTVTIDVIRDRSPQRVTADIPEAAAEEPTGPRA